MSGTVRVSPHPHPEVAAALVDPAVEWEEDQGSHGTSMLGDLLRDIPNLVISMGVIVFWLRVEHRLTRLETLIGKNGRHEHD